MRSAEGGEDEEDELSLARLQEAVHVLFLQHCALFECCQPKSELKPVKKLAPPPKPVVRRKSKGSPAPQPAAVSKQDQLWGGVLRPGGESPAACVPSKAKLRPLNTHFFVQRKKLFEEMKRISRARHRGNVALWSASLTDEVWKAEKAVNNPNLGDVNAYNGRGMTPLMLSAEAGSFEMVHWLLQNAADVNLRDKQQGASALHFAQEAHGVNEVLILVEHKADVSARDNVGRSVLMWGAAAGNSRAVQWMVAHTGEAVLEDKDRNGWTPVLHGCQSGSNAVVKAIVERGADINIHVKSKRDKVLCPLTIAVMGGHLGIAKMLHRKAALVSPAAVSCLSPEHQAVLKEVLTRSEAADAQVDRKTEVVLRAAAERQLQTLKKFLDPFNPIVDVNVEDDNGMTPLLTLSAIEDDTKNVVACLSFLFSLDGLNKQAEDHAGNNAFLLCTKQGSLEVMQLLLQNRVDVHSMDDRGRTAVMVAIEVGSLPKVQWIVETQGHSILHHRDSHGMSSSALAIQYGQLSIIDYLLSTPDLDIEDANDLGVTLLMIAGRKGYLELYKQLAQKGANTSATNTKGQTVLEYLEMCLHSETTKAESRGRVPRKTRKRLESISEVIGWHRFITGRPPSSVAEKSACTGRSGSRTFGAAEEVADKAYDAVSTAASVAKKLWGQGDKALKSAGMQALDVVTNPVSTLKKTGGVGFNALFKTVQAARNPVATMNKTRDMMVGTTKSVAGMGVAGTSSMVNRVANTGRALADVGSGAAKGKLASPGASVKATPGSARAASPFRSAAASIMSGAYGGAKALSSEPASKPVDSQPRPEWLVDEPTKKPGRRKEAERKQKTNVKTWLCSLCGEQNRGEKKECWSCHQAGVVEDEEYAADLSGIYEDKKKRRVQKVPKSSAVKSPKPAAVRSPKSAGVRSPKSAGVRSPRSEGVRSPETAGKSPPVISPASSKECDGGKPRAKGARRPSVTKSEKRPDRTLSSSGKPFPRVRSGKPHRPAAAAREKDQ